MGRRNSPASTGELTSVVSETGANLSSSAVVLEVFSAVPHSSRPAA